MGFRVILRYDVTAALRKKTTSIHAGKTRASEPAFSKVTLNTGSYIDCN